MNKSKQMKALALAVVAMMVLVSAAAMVPAQGMDAAAGDIPQGSPYGYILETDSANITVVNVTVNGEVQTTRGLTQWSYDSNGLGPFNTFYAAVNLANNTESGAPSEFSTETPLNTGAGQVAYVLDPDNLKQTIKKTTITQGKYNIMLVIPTVYWYSDAANNKLYMSNNPGYFSGTVSSSDMLPWAHTIKLADSTTVVKDHLMIGVYEGYVDESGRLTSQSGVIPKASQNIAAFRTNALTNTAAEDSYYGLWNFYQYTLYKMMAFTVMGSMDSQHAAGLGEGNVWGKTATSGTDAQKTALAASMTGDGDTKDTNGSQGWYGHKTDYSSQQTAGMNMNNQYSKVFIENSWGSVSEFVDDVWFSGRSMMVGNNVPIVIKDSATSHSDMGLNSDTQSAPATAVTVPTDNMISGASKVSQTWGVPTSSTSSSATGTLQNDKVWSNTGSRCLNVGGLWYPGANAGVGYFAATYSLGDSNYAIGARLAYLTSAASADYTIKYNVGTGGAVDGPAGGKYGEQVDLTVTSNTGYSLSSLTYSIDGGDAVDITGSKAFTISTNVETGVTVTAVFSKNSYAIAGEAVAHGTVTLSPATITKPYETAITVSDNVITIDGATVTATPNEGYSFSEWQFYDNSDPSNPQVISQPNTVPAFSIKAVASFTINSHTISTNHSGEGTVTLTGTASQPYGTTIPSQTTSPLVIGTATITATASEGYLLSGWEIYKTGDTSTSVSGSMPDYDITVKAVFVQDASQYLVTGSPTGGTLLFSGGTSGHTSYMSAGETVTITATPNTGLTLVSLSARHTDGSANVLLNGNTFTMPSAAVTVTAVFQDTSTEYTLRFIDTNANTSLVLTKHAGDVFPLPSATAAEGKEMSGWFTSDTGGSLIGIAGQYYTATESFTVYSQYIDAQGGSVEKYEISSTVTGTIDGNTPAVKGTHVNVDHASAIVGGDTAVVKVTKLVSAISVSLTATNSSVSQMGDGVWMLYGISDDVVVTVTVSPATDFGVSEFYISGLRGANSGADVVIKSKNESGLWAGEVSLKGTYSIEVNNRIAYAGFTTSASDVDKGDTEYQHSFSIPDNATGNKQIYWVYAIYSYDSTGDSTNDSSMASLGVSGNRVAEVSRS